VVLRAAGRTFVAGGDITLFDDPGFTSAPLNALLDRIAAGDRAVIAALHGTALGGGLEIALSAHARVAAPGTKIGLPGITLGQIPGSLDTQRGPRLAGLERMAERGRISSGYMQTPTSTMVPRDGARSMANWMIPGKPTQSKITSGRRF